jgi:hypothetical protein
MTNMTKWQKSFHGGGQPPQFVTSPARDTRTRWQLPAFPPAGSPPRRPRWPPPAAAPARAAPWT